jgi:very-short-patch-repair endonuclease
MLIHVAACQSYEAAMCIFDSAQNRGLIDRHRLRELGEVMGGRFLDLVLASTGLADSGLETLTRIRLAALGITMTPQVVVDGHKADGRIGERMYLQLDGLAPHSSREQREKDLYEDARLRLGGHTVFRFLGSQVQEQWGFVQDTILGAITQGLHLWPASQRDRA